MIFKIVETVPKQLPETPFILRFPNEYGVAVHPGSVTILKKAGEWLSPVKEEHSYTHESELVEILNNVQERRVL